MKVPGILKNKYVCYALMALAALNVVGYLTVKAWECLALFVLAGYSAHCYCKDKSVAILAALFVANFVFGCGRVKEGFEEALKGPVEHLQEAQQSAEAAASQCTGKDQAECQSLAAHCEYVNNQCQDKEPPSTAGDGSSGNNNNNNNNNNNSGGGGGNPQ